MDFIRLGLPQALASVGPAGFELSLRWTCLLLGVWCLVSTAEWLSLRRLFDDDGLLSWRVLSLRPHGVYRSRLLAPLFSGRGSVGLLGLRAACALLVVWPAGGWLRLAPLAGIVVTGWLLRLRKWLSEDGSDQMGGVVAVGAVTTALGLEWHDLLLCFAGSLAIAGQLAIAYFCGGIAKLVSAEWRSGRALVGIMGTHGFGHDAAARLVSSRAWLSPALCWLTMLLETVFPLIALAPSTLLAACLGLFALFHLATALLMGLNTYVWAFAATYPSVLLVNELMLDVLRRS